jgi:hypothetical protein
MVRLEPGPVGRASTHKGAEAIFFHIFAGTWTGYPQYLSTQQPTLSTLRTGPQLLSPQSHRDETAEATIR